MEKRQRASEVEAADTLMVELPASFLPLTKEGKKPQVVLIQNSLVQRPFFLPPAQACPSP